MLDPNIDLIRREERLCCSSGNSWDLGAQQVVQTFPCVSVLDGEDGPSLPLCSVLSVLVVDQRTTRTAGSACCALISYHGNGLQTGSPLSRITCGSAWEGSFNSETSGGIQRGVGFGRLSYHPSISQCGLQQAKEDRTPQCELGRTQGTHSR